MPLSAEILFCLFIFYSLPSSIWSGVVKCWPCCQQSVVLQGPGDIWTVISESPILGSSFHEHMQLNVAVKFLCCSDGVWRLYDYHCKRWHPILVSVFGRLKSGYENRMASGCRFSLHSGKGVKWVAPQSSPHGHRKQMGFSVFLLILNTRTSRHFQRSEVLHRHIDRFCIRLRLGGLKEEPQF